MELRMQHRLSFFIHYVDLEEFAKEKLHLESYSFVATEECTNDSSHEFNIDKKSLGESWSDNVKILRERGTVPLYGNHLVLAALCVDGHIPEGHYVVSVSW